jgi:predicted transcriptional regulator
MNKKTAMTIPEYARKMGITVQTVYNHIKEGKVKTITIVGKKLIKI